MTRVPVFLLVLALAACRIPAANYAAVVDPEKYREQLSTTYATTVPLQLLGVDGYPSTGGTTSYEVVPPPGFAGPEVSSFEILPAGSVVRLRSVEECTNFLSNDIRFRIEVETHAKSKPVYMSDEFLTHLQPVADEASPPDAARIDPALRELLKDVPESVLTDPLLVAASTGDADEVRALLKAGHAPERVLGGSLLEAIAGQADCEPAVLDALIDGGLDARRVGGAGSTALHAAAGAPSPLCYDLLLARGADPAHVNVNSWGVVANAYLSSDAAFFGRVLANESGEPRNPEDLATALLASLAKSDWPACRALLDAGADPDQSISEGPKRTTAAASRYGNRLQGCREADPPVHAAFDQQLAERLLDVIQSGNYDDLKALASNDAVANEAAARWLIGDGGVELDPASGARPAREILKGEVLKKTVVTEQLSGRAVVEVVLLPVATAESFAALARKVSSGDAKMFRDYVVCEFHVDGARVYMPNLCFAETDVWAR